MSSIGRRAFARILLLASGLVVTGACSNDLPTTSKAAQSPRLTIDPNAYYVIRNVETDKVMDVEGAGCCNGAWVHQWEYDGLTNQQWRIVAIAGGYYKILNRNSGRALDVSSASQSDGARIHQWGYDESYNQQWSLVDLGSGTYKIIARHSGKVATVSGGPNYYGSLYLDGVGIRQYAYTGAWTQHWHLELVP